MIDGFEAIVLSHQVDGRYCTINSARTAAVYLRRNWPAKRGPAHKTALRTCLDALNRKEHPDAARAAFLAALREAGIGLR
ncbi:DUF982 domain-containing protein [Metarhizobium album]|uniref:DUF982 domain-containing protein n=1 Tax=Metarhizobium album TaxID=2182425 RepID=A0A2U2DQ83_9HYPH|nr:DUF982 domain-containing protein [Rhizobium album]